MADAGIPQLLDHERVWIGLHRIKHVAGKAVEKLPGRGGEFLRADQIERFARLQAFDRFLDRGVARQRVDADGSVHRRSSRNLARASLGQAGGDDKKKRTPRFAGPFV